MAFHTSIHTHSCHTPQIFLEDAGFDWKVLGPDARQADLAYVAWQCDQDAYACSGQKCSAQSIMFAHSSWVGLGLFDRMKELAGRCGAASGPRQFWFTADNLQQSTGYSISALALNASNCESLRSSLLFILHAVSLCCTLLLSASCSNSPHLLIPHTPGPPHSRSRKLEDLTIGPVLTWTTDAILGHAKKLLAIPGRAQQIQMWCGRREFSADMLFVTPFWG